MKWLGREKSGLPCPGCCPHDPTIDKRWRMDGWIDGWMTVSSISHLLTRSRTERQLELLCTVYEVIQRSHVPMSSTAQGMMERVLLPLATHCSSRGIIDFFVSNISDISAILLSRFIKVCLFFCFLFFFLKRITFFLL